MGSLINILRHKWKPISCALFLYISWVFFLIFFKDDISEWQWLSSLFSNIDNKNAFFESYIASTLDSLGFFMVIGVITLIIGLSDPSQEALLHKINYIFPITRMNTPLTDYLTTKVAELGSIVTNSERTIDLIKTNDSKGLVKTSLIGTSHIKNIFSNHDFINNDMNFELKLDPIEGEEVFGGINDVSLVSSTDKLPDEHDNLKGPKIITAEQPSYKKSLSIKLKPSQGAIYKSNCWFWHKTNSPFKLNVNRFTKEQKYTIRNKCDEKIKVIVQSTIEPKMKADLTLTLDKLYQKISTKGDDSVFLEQIALKGDLSESLKKDEYSIIEKVVNSQSSMEFTIKDFTPMDKLQVYLLVDKKIVNEDTIEEVTD